ncbi:hypothetical protein [Paenibacillus sp. L3-i20]|uniref:hypothetical protein n=1 Tax=Paenibacillus sp. L3-i20 TaxID=2905833 RepID=UPI001EDF16FD|nr:hypothetical protein [Paenibacillus sp. L3-i20]GKU80506.1 hypothetical protein L3i20_v249030 [Paenibacillus sp. L3-i20]
MDRLYTLATIAHKLSASNRGRLVSEDTVMSWVRNGSLQAERVPPNKRGYGRYPYLVEEAHLVKVLNDKGYDSSLIVSNT